MSLALAKKRRTKFSEIFQCWKYYSKQTLKTELGRIDFEKISTGLAQQISKQPDHALGKVVDLLAPIVTKTVRGDRLEPSFVTKEKKKLKCLFKIAKKKKCPILIKKCQSLERNIKNMVQKSKCEKIQS